MPEPLHHLNADTPRTLTPDEEREIEEYANQIERTPQVGPVIAGKWRRWKRGQIIAAGSIEDRMERSFYAGVGTGIRIAVTMSALLGKEVEKREAEREKEEAEGEPK